MTTAFDQLMLDLFTTALEGGIGYWSQCETYHWQKGATTEIHPDINGFYADIIEFGDGDGGDKFTINRKVMVNGWHQAVGPWRDKIHWSSGEKPPLIVTADTDWDFDAGDADVIVQLGLFNDVIYG